MTLEQHLDEVMQKAKALYEEPSTYMPKTRYKELREAILAFYNQAARDAHDRV